MADGFCIPCYGTMEQNMSIKDESLVMSLISQDAMSLTVPVYCCIMIQIILLTCYQHSSPLQFLVEPTALWERAAHLRHFHARLEATNWLLLCGE